MSEIYFTGILSLLVNLPIFLFKLRKDFRERFNKINSKNKVDIVVEITVGLLYFLIIAQSFMSQIKVENFIYVFGCSFYMIG
jgi:hypothetical protein